MEFKHGIAALARKHTTAFLCISLAATWFLLLGVLAISQSQGGPLGLNIHPTGEDRVWTDFLDKHGFTTHRSWWALASRNPLAPWWYDATTVLSSMHPSGLFLSKKFVELCLAISSSLLVFEVLDRKRLGLCYSLGALVLVWHFSGYIEQILFVMIIALEFSLISLYAYIRYLKTRRMTNEWLLLSLAAYFVALGTYTIQCGIPLAVFFISLSYGNQALSVGSRVTAWYRTWLDAFYFAVVFVLFSMVWITTSGPTSSYFKVNAKLIVQNSWSSFKNMIWHQDTIDLTRSLFQNWSFATIAIAFALSFVVCIGIVRWIASGEKLLNQSQNSFPIGWNPSFVLFAIALSLAVPTFALEAMSTVWYPSSRSRMIQQVFQPLLYFTIVFGVLASTRKLSKHSFLSETAMAILIAFGALVSFEYNRKLSELSAYERSLVAGLKAMVPEVVRPTRFIVKLENDDWYGGRNTELNRILMKQSFGSDLVSLDAMYRGVPDPTICVKVADDQTGVFCPSVNRFIPYSEVIFASFDGKKVTPLPELNSKTFSGYQAVFQRETSHSTDRLVSMRPTENRIEFEFDAIPPGNGWSVPETSLAGESFVWMSGKSASFEFYRFANNPLQIRFRTLQPIAPEIRDSIQLSIGGERIPLKVVDKTDNKWIFEADLPSSDAVEIAIMKFDVSRTMAAPGTERQLAIPFDWIEVRQVPESDPRVSLQLIEPVGP